MKTILSNLFWLFFFLFEKPDFFVCFYICSLFSFYFFFNIIFVTTDDIIRRTLTQDFSFFTQRLGWTITSIWSQVQNKFLQKMLFFHLKLHFFSCTNHSILYSTKYGMLVLRVWQFPSKDFYFEFLLLILSVLRNVSRHN